MTFPWTTGVSIATLDCIANQAPMFNGFIHMFNGLIRLMV